MINREHDLPITKQALVLRISRGSVYYLQRAHAGSRPRDHATARPAASGVPFRRLAMLQGLLVAEGCKIGRRHVKTLMQRMGIEALYRRPRTTKAEPATRSTHIYCAVQRSRDRTRFGRWTSPISDGARLRLSGRCARLVQPSRAVVAPIDHDGGGVALRRLRTLSLATASLNLHTDQGSQFTGAAFTGVLIKTGSRSAGRQGAWRDTSSSSGCGAASIRGVYLRGYDSVSELALDRPTSFLHVGGPTKLDGRHR